MDFQLCLQMDVCFDDNCLFIVRVALPGCCVKGYFVEGRTNPLVGMLAIVCLHVFEGGCRAIVFLHSHVVPERVFARIVCLKACLSARPVCPLVCVIA